MHALESRAVVLIIRWGFELISSFLLFGVFASGKFAPVCSFVLVREGLQQNDRSMAKQVYEAVLEDPDKEFDIAGLIKQGVLKTNPVLEGLFTKAMWKLMQDTRGGAKSSQGAHQAFSLRQRECIAQCEFEYKNVQPSQLFKDTMLNRRSHHGARGAPVRGHFPHLPTHPSDKGSVEGVVYNIFYMYIPRPRGERIVYALGCETCGLFGSRDKDFGS